MAHMYTDYPVDNIFSEGVEAGKSSSELQPFDDLFAVAAEEGALHIAIVLQLQLSPYQSWPTLNPSGTTSFYTVVS